MVISVSVNHTPKGAGTSENNEPDYLLGTPNGKKGAANTTPPQERSASLVRKADMQKTPIEALKRTSDGSSKNVETPKVKEEAEKGHVSVFRTKCEFRISFSHKKDDFEPAISGFKPSEQAAFREIYKRLEDAGEINQEETKEIIKKHSISDYARKKLNTMLNSLVDAEILKVYFPSKEAKTKRISTQNATYSLSDKKFEHYENFEEYSKAMSDRYLKPAEQEAFEEIFKKMKEAKTRALTKDEIRSIFNSCIKSYDPRTTDRALAGRLDRILLNFIEIGVLELHVARPKPTPYLTDRELRHINIIANRPSDKTLRHMSRRANKKRRNQ